MRNVKLWCLLSILACSLLGNPAFANTVTMVNNSGYPDSKIFLLAWGYNPADTTGTPYHLDLLTGALTASSTADNTVVVPGQSDKYCRYWVTLDQIKQGDGTYSFSFPKINSGRLYISLVNPVYLHINPGNPVGMREPSVTNITDPNFQTIFDKFEWTYDDAGLHADITPIDFVGLSLKFEMKSGAVSLGTMGFSGSLASIFDALAANPSLKPLQTPYRFYSPMANYPTGAFPADYLDSYIDYCWNLYKTNTLTITGVVDEVAFTASGKVQTIGGIDTLLLNVEGTSEIHTILKPNSSQVFACNGDGVFNPAGYTNMALDRDGFIKDEIASALNRTVMHLVPTPPDYSEWATASNYYQQNSLPSNVFKTNIYSQILHQIAIDNFIYGYPWDDNNSQASYLSSATGTDLIVTINDLKGSSLAPANLLLLEE